MRSGESRELNAEIKVHLLINSKVDYGGYLRAAKAIMQRSNLPLKPSERRHEKFRLGFMELISLSLSWFEDTFTLNRNNNTENTIIFELRGSTVPFLAII